MDLGGRNGEGAGGVVKGVFHAEGGSVLFAFEEPDAAEAGKDLGVAGAIFGQGCFVLKVNIRIWSQWIDQGVILTLSIDLEYCFNSANTWPRLTYTLASRSVSRTFEKIWTAAVRSFLSSTKAIPIP